MKTAKEWYNTALPERELIKQIQLDAMKEGMRRAASEESLNIGDGEDYVRVQAILTTAEQLTIENL